VATSEFFGHDMHIRMIIAPGTELSKPVTAVFKCTAAILYGQFAQISDALVLNAFSTLNEANVIPSPAFITVGKFTRLKTRL
jgi:hypothetical protein